MSDWIRYRAVALAVVIPNTTLPQFEQTPGIERVDIEAKDNELVATFHTKGIFATDKDRFNDQAVALFAALDLDLGLRLGPPLFDGSDLPTGDSKRTVTSNVFGVNVRGDAQEFTAAEALGAANRLNANYSTDMIHYSFANGQSDPISRFTLLYSVALQVEGDIQPSICRSLAESRANSECLEMGPGQTQ